MVLALVSMTHSITSFPAAFMTAIEMLSLCTSMPIYLVLVIKGVPFWRMSRTLKTYSKKGAPFYNVWIRYCFAGPSHALRHGYQSSEPNGNHCIGATAATVPQCQRL